jgi:ABC-type antimicrobial peptide transport system permease subunit
VEYDYSDPALAQGRKVVAHHTVAGVVEDFRLRPHERYSYIILTPHTALSTTNERMLIRLRPEADVATFIARISQKDAQLELQTGNYSLALVGSYADYARDLYSRDIGIELSVIGIFIALLLLNVILGTLGTFWLQIRKRTEDIGIMRSFGAKRRDIFWMLWREAALLTFIAAVIGQIIWLQFAMNVGLAHGFTMSGTGQETDWVNTFWLHFLIVCVIQYALLLAIVTLGMVVPTFLAMYKRPVEALHHE